MTRVILVRHGQSEANVLDLFAGHSDYPLSSLGHRQAEKTAEYLASTKIDKLYSSDLPRAYMTAEHIAAKQNLSIQSDARLREILAGDWEGVNFAVIRDQFPAEYQTWYVDIGNGGCPGGESTVALWQRVVPAVEELAAANDGKTICIATHATALRVLECAWMQFPAARMAEISWISNAAVTVVDYDPTTHKAHFLLRDYHDHLAELATALPDSI